MEKSIWNVIASAFLIFLSIMGSDFHGVSKSAIAITLMIYIMGNAIISSKE